jgi:sugar/nucleoside kinase (ribokinase family)
VDARLAVDADLPTGCLLRLGERIVAERGANARLDPSDVPPTLAAGAVLVSGYVLLHDDSEAAALTALERSRSAWIAVDGASARLLEQYGRERFLDATGPATVLLVNADEASALTGKDPQHAAQRLASLYRLVCVKRGEAGAVACSEGRLLRTEAPRITLVDDSGAGDAFAGGLLAALAGGRSIEAALEEATRAGAAAASSHRLWPDAQRGTTGTVVKPRQFCKARPQSVGERVGGARRTRRKRLTKSTLGLESAEIAPRRSPVRVRLAP